MEGKESSVGFGPLSLISDADNIYTNEILPTTIVGRIFAGNATNQLPQYMWLLVAVLVPLISALIFHAITHWTRTARMLNRFPGPRQIPFLGNFNLIMGPPEEMQKRLSASVANYGRLVRIWFGYKPCLVIADGKVAEKIMAGYHNLDRADNYKAFHRILNQSISTAPGPKWRQHRKILNPAFNVQYFDGFVNIFGEQSKILVDIMEETFSTGEEQVNLFPYFNRATIATVFQTALGSQQDTQRNPTMEIVGMLKSIVKCTRLKLFRPYMDLPVIWNLFGMGREEDKTLTQLMDFLGTLIDAKFREREETGRVNGTSTKPFLAFLMDGADNREELGYQINALSFAGSETTASAMNYLLLLLALNPDIQEKLIEEMDAVYASELDGEAYVTMSSISRLKYTECCIKETLRLFPTVPAWMRKLSKDVELDDGKVIPVGTQVAILPYDIHRNQDIFPNPEKFDPERFNAENKERIPSGWWMPFSHGPRNCIGHSYAMLQMKTLLSHIFRRFTVHTTARREDVRVVYGLVLEPESEIRLTLKRRNNNN